MIPFNAVNTLSIDFIERPLSTLWSYISPLYMIDESLWLSELLTIATMEKAESNKVKTLAEGLISKVRADKKSMHLIDSLLLEYSLDTKEGIQLMCLAEALLRIPDTETADALIKDKLSSADWQSHLKNSQSTFVNASSWGLLITGKVVSKDNTTGTDTNQIINRLVNKLSEPVIRQAMHQAMKIMGHQFVLGRDINEAQKNGKAFTDQGCSYSFDMLGESALTAADASKYFESYLAAIESVGKSDLSKGNKKNAATVSIKLSALHPRYEVANKDRVLSEMFDAVLLLIKRAREVGVGLTIDAEEVDRAELSLMLFEKLYTHPECQGWGNFGIVVQAYSKRALPVLAWLAALAKQHGDCIPLRLVKGAYWDSEIKISQQNGYDAYPVYTRKEGTDVSYLACARFLLSAHIEGLIYSQFATHNAQTVAAISVMAQHNTFEFQRLHGMGDALYKHTLAMLNSRVRIYAPVGNHKDLLPYLVRRLLENGANSSFVHRLVDANCPIETLTEHPVDTLLQRSTLHNGLIPLPPYIFKDRKNAYGVNIDISSEGDRFATLIDGAMKLEWQTGAIVDGHHYKSNQKQGSDKQDKNETDVIYKVTAPYDRSIDVGTVFFANQALVETAIESAYQYFPEWQKTALTERAEVLFSLADLLEKNMSELIALCHKEAGKTIHDCIDEVREAVDFCRYYGQQALQNFASPLHIERFDGVQQQVQMQGKGVFVCISPWNFPLAIFIGQIAAALVSGNTVLAKPAEQTSLIAARAIELMLEAGLPAKAIHLLPGTGKEVGNRLTSDIRVTGVVFTGSTITAQAINQSLAERDSTEICTFVAETGGQNAMIVDSTALPEQVVRDVIRSAFASAGQRCSALRVLFIQEDIADRTIALIKGAMQELNIGLPYLHKTDVGPVIDHVAKAQLLAHIDSLLDEGYPLIAQVALDKCCEKGDFVPPTAIEIKSLGQLTKEHFGPILHVVRFDAQKIDSVIAQINDSGFGLTMGIHSRNEKKYLAVAAQSRVGNCYINRDQVGAAVGVQPFGGQGLSGTGPKAGGPRYLYRFVKQTDIKQVNESQVEFDKAVGEFNV